MQIVAERGVQRVLENVRELAGDFREARETVAAGGSGEGVRGDVQAFEIFAARRDFLQHANVLAQVLQMLRGFLEEDFDGFAVGHAHARPSVTSSGFCNSSAVGLR